MNNFTIGYDRGVESERKEQLQIASYREEEAGEIGSTARDH